MFWTLFKYRQRNDLTKVLGKVNKIPTNQKNRLIWLNTLNREFMSTLKISQMIKIKLISR